jgi:hypothetical protein
MKSTVTSWTCWSERYESLRRHCLDRPRPFEATPFGLVILRDKGLAHWMRRWIDSTLVPQPRSGQEPRSQSGTSPVSGAQLQLTLLLAQMATTHLPTLIAR